MQEESGHQRRQSTRYDLKLGPFLIRNKQKEPKNTPPSHK